MKSQVFLIPASGRETQESISQKAARVLARMELHEAIAPGDFIGLKIHFGERGNRGHIKPGWLTDMIAYLKRKSERVYISDSNTLYVGCRSNAVDHLELAYRHGFSPQSLGIPCIIADGLIGRDSEEISVDLPRIKQAKIAAAFVNTDVLVCLSHFTGHALTGFGAAIKNLGMGCASRAGKLEQHADVSPKINPKKCRNCGTCFDYCPENAIIEREGKAYIDSRKCIGCGECLVVCPAGAVKIPWDADKDRIQEKMAEYAYSAVSLFQKRIVCVNFLIKMTKDCDCMCKEAPAIVEDIGILASVDPVAVDQASVDLIHEKSGRDLLRDLNHVDWRVQLEHGKKIGLGNTEYVLDIMD